MFQQQSEASEVFFLHVGGGLVRWSGQNRGSDISILARRGVRFSWQRVIIGAELVSVKLFERDKISSIVNLVSPRVN